MNDLYQICVLLQSDYSMRKYLWFLARICCVGLFRANQKAEPGPSDKAKLCRAEDGQQQKAEGKRFAGQSQGSSGLRRAEGLAGRRESETDEAVG